jgi:hypothetical protein
MQLGHRLTINRTQTIANNVMLCHTIVGRIALVYCYDRIM